VYIAHNRLKPRCNL